MLDPDLFALTHDRLLQWKSRRLLLILTISFGLAGAWASWLLFTRVTVYAATDQARIEVAQAVYPIEAAVSGRVKKSYLALGRRVSTDDILVELEADPEKLRLSEEQSRYVALKAQREDLAKQLGAEQEALKQERAGGEAAVEQARARLLQAEEAAKLADEERKRDELLLAQGLISEIGSHQSESAAKQKAAEVEALRTAVEQAESQQLTTGGEHRARIEAIRTEIARLDGEVSASEATQQQLAGSIGSYYIKASSAGRLGSIVSLKPGAFVHQGDRLATIIPDGRLRIVAEFEPQAAIGHVKPGQKARMRLNGFPWGQYGSVPATVRSVGSEVRDGRVRVELEPHANANVRLQHGLPGTLEVAIDRVSPLAFLLTTSGESAARPASAPAQAASQ